MTPLRWRSSSWCNPLSDIFKRCSSGCTVFLLQPAPKPPPPRLAWRGRWPKAGGGGQQAPVGGTMSGESVPRRGCPRGSPPRHTGGDGRGRPQGSPLRESRTKQVHPSLPLHALRGGGGGSRRESEGVGSTAPGAGQRWANWYAPTTPSAVRTVCQRRHAASEKPSKNPKNFLTKPPIRSILMKLFETAPKNAAIAQSVERILGKDEVASSNLASSSICCYSSAGRAHPW